MTRLRDHLLVFLVYSVAVSCYPADTGAAGRIGEPSSLCSLLEEVEAGDVVPVVVSGIYQVAHEAQVLADPEQAKCRRDVQPITWIEFAPDVEVGEELTRLLARMHRAYLTFEGKLYGPGELPPDLPDLPFAAAFAERTRGRRYGHLGGYRTKLVVDAIYDVRAVPEGVEWLWGGEPPRADQARHGPEALATPVYPEIALKQGLAGEVQAQVTVVGGEVKEVEVLSGDRLLAKEAAANLRTWRFGRDTARSFVATFIYELEWRERDDWEVQFEFRPPALVKVVGPRYAW